MDPELHDLEVITPYPSLYPEQNEYMKHLRRAYDQGGVSLLEMPSGTGKTISILALSIAYQRKFPSKLSKLLYCSRTIPEIDKTFDELKRLQVSYAQNRKPLKNFLSFPMASRKNLCIHPTVSKLSSSIEVDSSCRDCTVSWNSNQSIDIEDISLPHQKSKKSGVHKTCQHYQNLSKLGTNGILPSGIYNLADLKEYGRKESLCPYFLARNSIDHANVLVWSYQYMIDPHVATHFAEQIDANSIVIFDEAHNIDNVCLEALSVSLTRKHLLNARESLKIINQKIHSSEESIRKRLNSEYQQILKNLSKSSQSTAPVPGTVTGDSPQDVHETFSLPKKVTNSAIPGTIRTAPNFVSFLVRFITYLLNKMYSLRIVEETPLFFIKDFAMWHLAQSDSSVNSANSTETLISPENETSPEVLKSLEESLTLSLKHCADRFISLIRSLQFSNIRSLFPLARIIKFASLLGTYVDSPFKIILEPFDPHLPQIRYPVLHLTALDPSMAIQPVFNKFSAIILTSGTLSPISIYPKLLNFDPSVVVSLEMSLKRPCLKPIIISHGQDQIPLTTQYEKRSDDSMIRNYGELLLSLVRVVPDGLVVFFPSYGFMEESIGQWDEMIARTHKTNVQTKIPASPASGVSPKHAFKTSSVSVRRSKSYLDCFLEHKLLFIESPSAAETSLTISHFRKACDVGKGALLFSVARGKVSEGIDFNDHYGRCVLIIGVPYTHVHSQVFQSRALYILDNFDIPTQEYLTFDALRHTAQCMGRVIRSKSDYGVMIFADSRFSRSNVRNKLPTWIKQFLVPGTIGLSTIQGINLTADFLRQIEAAEIVD